jgi:hypothetical protein
MPTNPLEADLRAWLATAYRKQAQTLERARAETNDVSKAALEDEAQTLYGCCLTLEDCLYAYGSKGKRVRLAVYKEIGKYQRHADTLQHSLGAEADALERARVSGSLTIYHQVVQDWSEILGSA